MKKSIISVIAAVLLIFMMTGTVFASSAGAAASKTSDTSAVVTKVPDIKIILEGTYTQFKNVPVSVKGNTLLPLREYLVNLGVPDNDNNIRYNTKDKSVYIKYEETEVVLYIAKNTAYVNNEPVTLNTAPILYNNLTYIPVRSIAELFGKKVVWNGELRTILICDADKYNEIRKIMVRNSEASSKAQKYKMDMTISTKETTGTASETVEIRSSGGIDVKSKKMSMDMVMKFAGFEVKTSSYYTDSAEYTLNPLDNNWYRTKYTDDEYNSLFEEQESDFSDDSLIAGLNFVDSENEDEIILSGNVLLKDLFNSILSQQSLSSDTGTNMDDLLVSDDFSMTFVIDKNTYLLKKIIMKISAEDKTEKGAKKTEISITGQYYDYDGAFEIVIPEYVIRNAIDW